MVFLTVLVDAKKNIVQQEKFKMGKIVNVNALKEFGAQNIKFGMKKIVNAFAKMKRNGALLVQFLINTNVNVFVSIKNVIKVTFLMKNNASVSVIKIVPRTSG